jgi:hypothetical protein
MRKTAVMSASAYNPCAGITANAPPRRYRVRVDPIAPCVDGRLPGQNRRTHKKTAGRRFLCFIESSDIHWNPVMVPKRGLEPLRLTSLPPQGSASTSSATWAGVLLSAWPAAPWLPAPRPDSWSGRGLPPAVQQPVRRCWLQQGRPRALPSRSVQQVLSSRRPACWQVHP